MSGLIDLHVHTTASDGSDSTEEVISLAKSEGLEAIAITDHDTVCGVPDYSVSGIEVVPGIEFSTRFKSKVHILGYYIDVDNKALKNELYEIVNDRDSRNEKIVKLMNEDGIDVSYSEMKDRFGEIVGRPHFAEILIEKGIVPTVAEAFDRYLEKGRKYWVKRHTLELEDCISLITGAGGVAVIAHPFEYKYDKNSLADLIEECMRLGAKGIECRHSSHTSNQMSYLERRCDDYNLLKTGGSDYHGIIKPEIRLGHGKNNVEVPCSWLDKLKECR